jgi:asparaginyl-tRNA synthetase
VNVGTHDGSDLKEIDSKRRKAIFRIQGEIVRSARKFLESGGFLEVLPPIFETFTDTGIGEAGFFEIDYYGKPYKLMSALTIHKPILVTQLGDMFSFMPCSRREPAGVRHVKRHLSQFYQIEVEMEGGQEAAMGTLERMIKAIIGDVKASCAAELGTLGRKRLEIPEAPFRRMTYADALRMAKDIGMPVDAKAGLSWDVEKELSRRMGEPFFITSFPADIIGDRGFLYKVDGDILLDFDLIMPEGHGEVSSGSEREYEYDKIVRNLGKEKINSFRAYLEIAKSGLKPTAGFGIGVERLTKFICGLDDIADASPFPKVPGGNA